MSSDFTTHLTAAAFDGTHAGEVEPCPTCLKRIAFGAGVTHGWHRTHDWCVPIRRLN